MRRSFFERVRIRLRQTGACLVVGLDPRQDELSDAESALFLHDPAQALVAHAARIRDATADLAVAWKLNLAFYEEHGAAGMNALQAIVPMLQLSAPVILDAKRGDIGSTAESIARYLFETLQADAITMHPLLGADAIAPLLAYADKGVFLLARTSNPGAAELQDLDLAGAPLWTHIVHAANGWYSKHSRELALVVGATTPDALHHARELAPDAWILAPGVGAQGAEVTTVLAARRPDGSGLLVPITRGITSTPDPRAAALAFVEALRFAPPLTSPIPGPLHALADALVDRGLVRFGEFTLKSGARSPIYIDLRRLVTFPDLLSDAANALYAVAQTLRFTRLAALPYAALPIGTALALASGWPLVYPRREAKDYGTQVAIEGLYDPGDTVLILDDVASRGDSKLEAFTRLEAAGLVVNDVLVLIDRQGGARQLVEAAGKRLHAVFTLSELVDHWHLTGRLDDERANLVRSYLATT